MCAQLAVNTIPYVALQCPHGCDSLPKNSLDGLVDYTRIPHVDLVGCPHCLNPIAIYWQKGAPVPTAVANVPALAQLAVPGSVMAEILARLPEYVENMPTPPDVARRVIGLVHDPLSSTAEVAGVVGTDPGFSVRVLRLANSAALRGTAEIRDITTACTRVGSKTLLNFAHSMSYRNAYASSGQHVRSAIPKLWRRSLSTAHFSSRIASILRDVDSGRMFLAGLSRDIGMLVMLDLIAGQPHKTKHLLASPKKMKELLLRFGPFAGLQVVQRWGLESPVRQFVFFADDPDSILDRDLQREATLLVVSALVVRLLGDSPSSDGVDPAVLLPALTDERLAVLEISRDRIVEGILSTLRELDSILDSLRVD